MRTLYFDCFSGISGDMALAALVDAGADPQYIQAELSKLNIEPFTLQWNKVLKCGISALKANVLPSQDHPPQHHRHFNDIVELMKRAELKPKVLEYSVAIFEKIALAEGKIHNVSMEKVHFHEVGAVDSIVDIVGVSLALDDLHIEKIISSPLPLGYGSIRCAHGHYPIPAPATLEMLKGIPLQRSKHDVEMTTPTGAAIISALATRYSNGIPNIKIERIGYGAGTYDLHKQPNVLRVVIGSEPIF